MFIIRHRNIFFWLAGIITAASIAAVAYFGAPLSIEFTGGSLVEVAYTAERPSVESVRIALQNVGEFEDASIRESGENGITVRTHSLTPEEHEGVLAALSLGGEAPLTELRSTTIGPSLGTELGIKALWALVAVIAAIVLYIAWAFRKVSHPVTSWVYGLTVVLILIHDVIVPTGFFAIWAAFTGAQFDSLFVVAILAILGYSVNDTIVIFDRVRENLRHNQDEKKEEPFEKVVARSVTETLGRSINTSVTVALSLIALVVVGSPATLNFAIVLLVGVVVGTYSSILVAAPLLVPFAKLFSEKEAKKS